MRLTDRDVKLVKDVALSHVLSRDQIISLGYFTSVTRANTRLRLLAELGLVKRLDTPFFAQSLYSAGPKASEVVGSRIAPLVEGRKGSPRFLQHALSVTNVRLALLARGALDWRFEQQLWLSFRYAGQEFQVRPDGMAVTQTGPLLIEVDMGHVALPKFGDKLKAYQAFASSGEWTRHLKATEFRLLVVTTGTQRASRLARLAAPFGTLDVRFQTFGELSIPQVGAWS